MEGLEPHALDLLHVPALEVDSPEKLTQHSLFFVTERPIAGDGDLPFYQEAAQFLQKGCSRKMPPSFLN